MISLGNPINMRGMKARREVMKYYDEVASSYDGLYSSEQSKKYEAIYGLHKPRGAILDLACGTGGFLQKAAPHAKLLVGIDLSASMIRKGIIKLRNYGNVDLIVGDAHLMPFRRRFDEVYIITAIHIFDDLSSAMLEIARVLKGDVIVVTLLKKAIGLLSNIVSYFNSKGFILWRLIDRDDVADVVMLFMRGSVHLESEGRSLLEGSLGPRAKRVKA